MARFGFVNFWVYDCEEFDTCDGKILLRGSNGSGKSITTQSFIPYILDGNHSPYRLDPFGSKDRKMSYYLIGDGEHMKDESTGYVWMEFVKPESQQYRTIGIGLHARKNGNMNTWGFCILDGRRINIDFSLHEERDNQIIPYDMRTLKKLLGEQNLFTEKTTEYKEMVADKIFGIPKDRIEDFDQLTNILIKTRSSKLASKENLKPEGLYAILNESLRTLTDDDLRPMTDAMTKIEDAHNKIDNSIQALNEAKYVNEEYDRYNRYMLWIKSKKYLEKQAELNKAIAEHEKRKKSLSDEQYNERINRQNLEAVQEKIHILQEESASINISDIKECLEKKANAERNLKNAEDEEKNKKQLIEKNSESIGKKYLSRKNTFDDLEYIKSELESNLQDMSDYAENNFPFYDSFFTMINNGEYIEKRQYDSQINSFKSKIEDISRKLHQHDYKKQRYEDEYEKFSRLETEYQNQQKLLQEAERQTEACKDELIEKLYISVRENKEYHMDNITLKRAEEAVVSYDISSGGYRDILLANYKDILEKLTHEKSKAELKKDNIESQKEELESELEHLKNSPETVPMRSESRISARKALETNNIPYRSFYECVDFKPTVRDDIKAVIESELSDMEILDTLIIPDKYLDKAKNILSNYSDSYFCTENGLLQESSYFDVTVDGEFSQTVKAVLSEIENKVSLTENGYYKNGVIAGYADKNNKGGFIGVENRKKYRQNLIDRLEEKIKNILQELETVKQACREYYEREKILKDEYNNISNISDLDTALQLYFEYQRSCNNAMHNMEEHEDICEKQKNELLLLWREIENSCCIFPYYSKTSVFFDGLLSDISNYSDTLYICVDCLKNKKIFEEKLNFLDEQIAESENAKDDLYRDLNGIQQRIRQYRAEIENYQKFLDSSGSTDKIQRYETINSQIEKFEKDCQQYQDNITESRTKINLYSEDISEKETFLNSISKETDRLSEYFSEELAIGFVFDKEDKSLSECAELAKNVISEGDEMKNTSDMSTRLINAIKGHSNILSAEYRLMNDVLFESSGADTVRSRNRITLFWQGKTVSPSVFTEELDRAIKHDKELLKKDEENIFKEILMNTISRKLTNRIRESSEWIERMSDMMADIQTSMGLVFRLQWTAKKEIAEGELSVDELNKLLATDKNIITQSNIDRITTHFRKRIEHERRLLEEKGADINYSDIIKNVLDFRNWYEFKLQYKEPKMSSFGILTASRFNKFSGGERALSLYIPLFAAVAAQYEKAGEQAPKILALDEAFAGVDESNISQMFGLLEKLNFGYIMNSQALWGCYDTVPSLYIAELLHNKEDEFITVIKYQWNGNSKNISG